MVNSQKGQSLVEFALIIPLFLLLILGMIYGGFAYADYLQYSTAVREAARDIAMQSTQAKRSAIVAGLNSNSASTVKQYADPLTNLYAAEFSASLTESTLDEPGSVTVRVALTRNVDVLVLPQSLATLQCTMPIEQDLGNTEQSAGGSSGGGT